MSNPKSLQLTAILQILGFVAVLVLPLAATNFHAVHQRSDVEKRDLNDFPAWEWNRAALDAFPAKFEAAFNDHFGFRDVFTRWHSLIKVYVLGMSPVDKVILGKQEWLYLSRSVMGKKISKESDVVQWGRELQTKQAWLAARGIRYLLVVPPNKEEVYPEYLPNSISIKHTHRYLDGILKGLSADLRVNILDLREPLCQGRSLGMVYDRTDTHWSHLGMFLATNEILLRLHRWYPELQPAPLDQRPQTPVWGPGGDLARMIGLQSKMWEERLTVPPAPASFQEGVMRSKQVWPENSLQDPPLIYESRGSAQKLTMLITGDSFGLGLLEFLPEHFRRVVRLRPDVPYTAWFQGLLPGLVEAEKPDVYLDVLCSRSMRYPPKVLFPAR